MIPTLKKLISEYNKRKSEIKKRLKEFSLIHKGKDGAIFEELCFCLLTANANALKCAEAIKELKEKGFITKGGPADIRPLLKGRVRFHNKKASFITDARKAFTRDKCLAVKDKIDTKDAFAAREWLVNNIKGLGYKEASHFLRNIGLGKNIAILDRHILKNLKKYGVINRIPASLGGRKIYLDIEKKLLNFSAKIRIPPDELDLLFWSLETGFVFK